MGRPPGVISLWEQRAEWRTACPGSELEGERCMGSLWLNQTLAPSSQFPSAFLGRRGLGKGCWTLGTGG